MKITYKNYKAIEHGVGCYLVDNGYMTVPIEGDDYKFDLEIYFPDHDCFTIEEYREMRKNLDYVVNLVEAINNYGLEVIDDDMLVLIPDIRPQANAICKRLYDGESIENILESLKA